MLGGYSRKDPATSETRVNPASSIPLHSEDQHAASETLWVGSSCRIRNWASRESKTAHQKPGAHQKLHRKPAGIRNCVSEAKAHQKLRETGTHQTLELGHRNWSFETRVKGAGIGVGWCGGCRGLRGRGGENETLRGNSITERIRSCTETGAQQGLKRLETKQGRRSWRWRQCTSREPRSPYPTLQP